MPDNHEINAPRRVASRVATAGGQHRAPTVASPLPGCTAEQQLVRYIYATPPGECCRT